jgi:hypothetical protein
MVHEFEKSLHYEKSQFRRADAFYREVLLVDEIIRFATDSKEDMKMQLQDIDVQLIKTNRVCHVSEKFREKDFGDLYIEVFSKYPHMRGWLETGLADMLVYFVPEVVYWCNAKNLRKFCVDMLFPMIPAEWYKEIYCSATSIISKNMNFFDQQTIVHLIKANNQTSDGSRWCTIGISVPFEFLKNNGLNIRKYLFP